MLPVERVASELKPKTLLVAGDMANEDFVKTVHEQAMRNLAEITYVVVHAAGTTMGAA